MLKQQTRERLQSLAQNPDFFGAVHIQDKKYKHNGNAGSYVDVDIFGDGLNVFNLLAELFPDMNIGAIIPYETDHGDHFSFGNYAKGTIEEAGLSIWSTHGERQKEIDPLLEGATEEIVHYDSITDKWSLEDIMRQEG